jgi:hypothetical protein
MPARSVTSFIVLPSKNEKPRSGHPVRGS